MHLEHHAGQALLLRLKGPLQVVQQDEQDIVDLVAAQESEAVGQPALRFSGNVALANRWQLFC